MNARCYVSIRDVTVCTLLAGLAGMAYAAELSVTIRLPDGSGLKDAVAVAEPAQPAAAPRNPLKAVMDQHGLQFVPGVLAVRTGTAVEFPNSDQVRHQVYSFSPAKKFQLSLYLGREHSPVVFDKPGLVVLGCNIHDSMIGYVYVTDSPWFGFTGGDGVLKWRDLAAGEYNVKIWHPRMREVVPQPSQRITVGDSDAKVEFTLTRSLRPGLISSGADKSWADY